MNMSPFRVNDWIGVMGSSMTPIQTAVINGLAEEVDEIISANPRSVMVFTAEGETLLHLALKHSQLEVFLVLLKKIEKPMIRVFLNWQDKEGNTILHLAMIRGMNMRPFCDDDWIGVMDEYTTLTPIQTAVINGLAEEVDELISANPWSVMVFTSEGETLLHLALKHSQLEVFLVLLKKIEKPMIREFLLNWQDKEGNTILHLAIPNRLVEVLKMLLPENSNHLVGVNSQNKKGLTALDLYLQGIAMRELLPTQLEALAVTVTPLPPQPPPQVVQNYYLEEMQGQVAFVGILAGASFGIICNIPSSFSTGDAGGIVFKAADVLAGRLPPILYLMVLNTAVVVVSLGAAVKAMWKLPNKPFLLFVSITISFVYAVLVDHVIPKFWVRIGSLNVVSSAMVWLLSGAYVASPAIAYYAVSYGFRYLIRLIKPLISKIKRELPFLGNGHILPMTR